MIKSPYIQSQKLHGLPWNDKQQPELAPAAAQQKQQHFFVRESSRAAANNQRLISRIVDATSKHKKQRSLC